MTASVTVAIKAARSASVSCAIFVLMPAAWSVNIRRYSSTDAHSSVIGRLSTVTSLKPRARSKPSSAPGCASRNRPGAFGSGGCARKNLATDWPAAVRKGLFVGSVVLETNSTHTLLAAARASVGVAVLPRFVARRYPDLMAVSEDVAKRDVWMITHPEYRRDPKIRATADFLKRAATGPDGLC